MKVIGETPMPAGFRYRDIFLRGKPEHNQADPFRRRHPSMDVGKRAKLFAPFDALRGFDEAVESKNVLYEDKVILNEEDAAELDRRLMILHNLTYNGRMARANQVEVTVTVYEACSDENHEDYGAKGQYQTLSGICWNVDAEVTKTILVGKMRIRIEDIRRIESPGDLFQTGKIPEEAI